MQATKRPTRAVSIIVCKLDVLRSESKKPEDEALRELCEHRVKHNLPAPDVQAIFVKGHPVGWVVDIKYKEPA